MGTKMMLQSQLFSRLLIPHHYTMMKSQRLFLDPNFLQLSTEKEIFIRLGTMGVFFKMEWDALDWDKEFGGRWMFATDVVVGDSHMVVLTKDGEILTTGDAAWGRLGNLEPDDQAFLEPVELLAAEDICQISGGDEYSLALTSDGVVFAWGKNHKGQCGTGSSMSVDMYAMENMPQPVDGMMEGQHVVKISGGHSHAAAVTDKGELFWWGSQLNLTPELAPNLAHTKIVDVACGKDYTIALDEEGRLYSFGSGKTGVLGLANEKKAVAPTLVEGMLGKKVVKVDAGWSHVACLVEEVDGEGTDNTV